MEVTWLSIPISAITTIIVAILAYLLPPLIQKWRSPEEKGKDRANAAGVISEASIRMVEHWEARVKALEAKVERLEAKVEEQGECIKSLTAEREVYKKGTAKLQEQVSGLGYEPIWNP